MKACVNVVSALMGIWWLHSNDLTHSSSTGVCAMMLLGRPNWAADFSSGPKLPGSYWPLQAGRIQWKSPHKGGPFIRLESEWPGEFCQWSLGRETVFSEEVHKAILRTLLRLASKYAKQEAGIQLRLGDTQGQGEKADKRHISSLCHAR